MSNSRTRMHTHTLSYSPSSHRCLPQAPNVEKAFVNLMRSLLQLSKVPWLDADADNEYKEHMRDIQSCIKTMNKKGEGP